MYTIGSQIACIETVLNPHKGIVSCTNDPYDGGGSGGRGTLVKLLLLDLDC